jgi:hypothetical protein
VSLLQGTGSYIQRNANCVSNIAQNSVKGIYSYVQSNASHVSNRAQNLYENAAYASGAVKQLKFEKV